MDSCFSEQLKFIIITGRIIWVATVNVDRDRPIAMLNFSALTRPYDPTITVNQTVNQDAGRESCLGQGSLSVSRSLPRGPHRCAAYGPRVP